MLKRSEIVPTRKTPIRRNAASSTASHTHGSDAVLDAAFRRIGVSRVGTISDLFNMAEV